MPLGLGIGLDPTLGKQNPRAGFEAETLSLLARFTTQPSAGRAQSINVLMKTWKDGGLFAKCDAFYMFRADDAQSSLLNWISTSYNLTAINSPTFVANSHYVGNGTTSYLDTGFNPTTAPSPKMVQDSAHFGIWHLTDTDNGGALSYSFGNSNTFLARTIGVTGGITYRISRSSSNTHSSSVVLPGHVLLNRTTSLLFDVYFAGLDVGGASAASAALTNAVFRICSFGASGFSTNQIQAVHFGSQLTAGEALAAYNALVAYRAAV